MTENHDGDALPGDRQVERVLVFRLADELHAIRVAEIGGVASCEALRELPCAPPGVLGLAEWRGSVLSVLDLPRILGRAASDDPVCLIRLAPPLDQTAFYLPATVRLTESELERHSTEDDDGTEPVWFCDGETVRLVDPRAIVREIEARMRKRN